MHHSPKKYRNEILGRMHLCVCSGECLNEAYSASANDCYKMLKKQIVALWFLDEASYWKYLRLNSKVEI